MNMMMPLGTPGLTGFKVGGKASVFDSWGMRHLTGGITIDRSLVLPGADVERVIYAGEVVGMVADTGLYGPWDPGASDGREIARGVVVQDTNVTNGNAFVGAADECRVHAARMPRSFTSAEWGAINASPYVRITPAEPFNVPGPAAISVALAPSALALAVGEVAQLTPVFNPADAVNQNGAWESSAPAVAAVSASGLVSAVAAGTASVTFRTQVGNIVSSASAVTVS
jgi:hypothetical protein